MRARAAVRQDDIVGCGEGPMDGMGGLVFGREKDLVGLEGPGTGVVIGLCGCPSLSSAIDGFRVDSQVTRLGSLNLELCITPEDGTQPWSRNGIVFSRAMAHFSRLLLTSHGIWLTMFSVINPDTGVYFDLLSRSFYSRYSYTPPTA